MLGFTVTVDATTSLNINDLFTISLGENPELSVTVEPPRSSASFDPASFFSGEYGRQARVTTDITTRFDASLSVLNEALFDTLTSNSTLTATAGVFFESFTIIASIQEEVSAALAANNDLTATGTASRLFSITSTVAVTGTAGLSFVERATLALLPLFAGNFGTVIDAVDRVVGVEQSVKVTMAPMIQVPIQISMAWVGAGPVRSNLCVNGIPNAPQDWAPTIDNDKIGFGCRSAMDTRFDPRFPDDARRAGWFVLDLSTIFTERVRDIIRFIIYLLACWYVIRRFAISS